MFKRLRQSWDETAATIAGENFDRLVSAYLSMSEPVQSRMLLHIDALLRNVHATYPRIDDLPRPNKAKLAKVHFDAARDAAQSIVSDNWACVAVALWFETASLDCPSAPLVHARVTEFLAPFLAPYYGPIASDLPTAADIDAILTEPDPASLPPPLPR
jgi:hypothetical protein